MSHATLLSTLALLAACLPASASPPEVRAKVALAFALARVGESVPPTVASQPAAKEPVRRLSWAEARAESIRTGKPVIVWSGAAVCENCIDGNSTEFVHYVGTEDSRFPKDTLSVLMPKQGELVVAGRVKEWPDGHIPTVRAILRRRDATPPAQRRTLTDADMWGGTSTITQARPVIRSAPVSQPIRFMPPPVVFRSAAPMPAPRFSFGGAACAT